MPKFATPADKLEWMTTAPIPGLVGRLAVPTIISMLITSIYNMADTYFVGKLSTSAQGAVGVVFSLMAIIQAVGFTFGQGSGTYVSRLLGRKETDKADQVVATGFFGAILAGLVIAVLGLLFLDPLVRLLGATPTILPYARSYARYILIGAPWMIGSLVLNNLLRFQGNAFYAMVGITTGGILNMILDPIFIFTFRMEIGGAALATIISQGVSFLILLFNTGRNGTLSIHWSRIHPGDGNLATIFKGGFPSLARQGLASAASILLNWSAKPFGDAAIAAMAIVSKVSMFSGSAMLGFGQGFQPVCGFNFGAKRYDRVRQAFWFCLKVGTAVLACMTVVGVITAPFIVQAFQKNDPEVVRLGSFALRVQFLTLPTVSFVILNNMMLQTSGETGKASLLAMARQGLFFIPIILIFPALLRFTGVAIAQPVSDACAFLLAIPISAMFLKKLKRLERGELTL